MQAIAQGVAESLECRLDFKIVASTPAVINHPVLTSHVREVVRQSFPEDELDTGYQTMGSEDMAEMMQTVPGCYFFVGSANPEADLAAPHHHPQFNFDEAALPRAAGLMAAAAWDVLTHT